MNIYTVHLNPHSTTPLETAILVREGVSFGAMLLTIFWMIYKKIWWAAGAILLFNIVLSYLEDRAIISNNVLTAINVIAILLIGFWGNDWYRYSLKRRGFVFTDIVSGTTEEQAERRFYDHYLGQTPA